MKSQAVAVYPLIEDLPVKKRFWRSVFLRGMIALFIIIPISYPAIKYLSTPSNTGRYLESIQIPLINLPEGASQLVSYRGQPILVINHHGSIKALSALCTYNGTLLVWDKGREELVCSSHDARFDVNGNVKAGLAPRPLDRINVMVVEGNIIVGDAL